MGQTYRKFRAATFDEAYRLMVRELGRGAVVINTREVTEGGVFGLLGRRVIELTASAPEPFPPPRRSGMIPDPQVVTPRKLTLAEKRYTTTEAEHAAAVGSDETFGDTVDFFKKVVSEAQARIGKDVKPSPLPAPPVEKKPQVAAPTVAVRDERMDGLRAEVREMRALLQALVADRPCGDFPPEFASAYRALVSDGVCRKTAAMLVSAAMEGSDRNVIRDPKILAERIKVEIQKRVTVTRGIQLTRGTRHTVALVGATGVGKTTNLAKLAAVFAVQHRARVALITTDTYRVAAPEQLRVYANIIGLPMLIANDGGELLAALKTFADYDLVLIDTVGGSQFNASQISELQAILDAARLDEVILVLSASTQLEELRSAVRNFGVLVPTSLMFSKLDETRYFGTILTVAIESGVPLGYFSTGQNVPNDIELASGAKMASLVMEGGDPVGSGA